MRIIKSQTKDSNIIQITTMDERWYQKVDTGEFYPSVTWIAHYYPKGKGFENWLASKGMDEAEAIKMAAGERGSRVHRACEDLTLGNTVDMQSVYPDNDGNQKELSLEEWEAVISFYNFWQAQAPKLIQSEQVVFNDEHKYAGTMDMLLEIDGKKWIVDLKTSKSVYPSHEIQISAYKHCLNIPEVNLAILQVGYNKNKQGWKWNVVNDCFPLFLSVKDIWAYENEGVYPKQKDYPISLTL